MGGLMLANTNTSTEKTTVAHAAKTMRTVARGPWLLPFASVGSGAQAVALGDAGVPLAMPSVQTVSGSATAAASAIITDYGAMYKKLGGNWVGKLDPGTNQTHWENHGKMVFVSTPSAVCLCYDICLDFA